MAGKFLFRIGVGNIHIPDPEIQRVLGRSAGRGLFTGGKTLEKRPVPQIIHGDRTVTDDNAAKGPVGLAAQERKEVVGYRYIREARDGLAACRVGYDESGYLQGGKNGRGKGCVGNAESGREFELRGGLIAEADKRIFEPP